jgi:hypothetical protein
MEKAGPSVPGSDRAGGNEEGAAGDCGRAVETAAAVRTASERSGGTDEVGSAGGRPAVEVGTEEATVGAEDMAAARVEDRPSSWIDALANYSKSLN